MSASEQFDVGRGRTRSSLDGRVNCKDARRRCASLELLKSHFCKRHARLHDKATRSVDLRREFKLAGLGIDDDTRRHHSGASDEVVCALSATAGQLRCLLALRHELADGRSRLAGKALHSLKTLCYPLSTLPWDLGAKRSLVSDKVAPWFSG